MSAEAEKHAIAAALHRAWCKTSPCWGPTMDDRERAEAEYNLRKSEDLEPSA